jgi:hypothetical protein
VNARQILSLEETIGARLLNRTTRHQALTEIGHIYYERARRALQEGRLVRVLADYDPNPAELAIPLCGLSPQPGPASQDTSIYRLPGLCVQKARSRYAGNKLISQRQEPV